MEYTPQDVKETVITLGTSFIVGVIAQFLKQKADPAVENTNIWWLSLAAGFSAMVAVGLLYEYTNISSSLLISISGIAGWTGISILATFSGTFDQMLVRTAQKKFDVELPAGSTPQEVEYESITRVGSQSE